MRYFLAIPFIFLGAILLSLTINDLGNMGHVIMKTIGVGCFFIAHFIVRRKRKKEIKHSN
ncbi:hypothetical protein LCL95_01430 [Bacillus timonensis]|nr:hypothetical protein [Bacillus timonensis]